MKHYGIILSNILIVCLALHVLTHISFPIG